MNYTLILIIGISILALALIAYFYQNNISAFVRQGFQNPGAETVQAVSPKNEFILYYADWCPHCKNVKPEMDKLAPNGTVVVGGQNIKVSKYEQTKNKDQFAGKEIKGFPTIIFYDADSTTTEYKGARTSDAFLEFLNKQLGGGV